MSSSGEWEIDWSSLWLLVVDILCTCMESESWKSAFDVMFRKMESFSVFPVVVAC